jgi:hypothetical protein
MTNQQHPIVPDPELLQEWYDDKTDYFADMIRAAQWGADQELEACCEWLVAHQWHGPSGACLVNLRAGRRSKPPSLKEQALEVLGNVQKGWGLAEVDLDTIRCALEALPE